MKYWNFKLTNNIFSFSDLSLYENKLSKENYNLIADMIEWEISDFNEQINLFRLTYVYKIMINFDKNEMISQQENQFLIFFSTKPYILDWLLINWEQVYIKLNFDLLYNFFLYFEKIIKKINYNFEFKIKSKNFSKDKWGIKFYSDTELLEFIENAKNEKKYLSIDYLFDKHSTLESLSKSNQRYVTRERIRQIVYNEIKNNIIFFERIYEFIQKRYFEIEKLNKATIKVIEKIIYPNIITSDSILNQDSSLIENVIKKFSNYSRNLLEFSDSEKNFLIENNCIVSYKNNFYEISKKYWKKSNLRYRDMLIIFLNIKYEDTQIIDKFNLLKEFSSFLEENNHQNYDYNLDNFRPFESLVSRVKELLYYDEANWVVSLDKNNNNSVIADAILVKFIDLKQQDIIMISTKNYLKLFNKLTKYKFLDINSNFVHNFLKKNTTIENSTRYFSRMPILLNLEMSGLNNSNISIFYKQVQKLFKNQQTIDWKIFVEILQYECGFEETLVRNYISGGSKYFMKKDNRIILKKEK